MEERPNALFHNSQDGTFTDMSIFSGIDEPLGTMGVAYADYDRDGDLDLITGNWNAGYRLYQNLSLQSSDNHWISLSLVGNDPINKDAVGSRVFVTTTDGLTQMQAVKIGSGLGGNSQATLHFGLGRSSITAITIMWTDGMECSFEAIGANQHIEIKYHPSAICIVEDVK